MLAEFIQRLFQDGHDDRANMNLISSASFLTYRYSQIWDNGLALVGVIGGGAPSVQNGTLLKYVSHWCISHKTIHQVNQISYVRAVNWIGGMIRRSSALIIAQEHRII